MAEKDYLISKDLLLSIFQYKDGLLYRGNQPVEKKDTKGYVRTKINGKEYLAHRVIFMMHHGYLPKYLDHIDGNRNNNRIENLREATSAENNRNRKVSTRNTTGVKGVSLYKKNNKWKAQCTLNYKQHHLGYFFNIEDAKKAVEDFRSLHHGDFARQE